LNSVGKTIKRILAVLAGAGLLVFLGIRVYDAQQLQSTPKAGKKGGARTVNVDIIEASVGAVREELLLTGALKPKETVDITPKATGRVEKLYFQIGDTMRLGDPVADLDDEELQQQVNRAQATIQITATSMVRSSPMESSRAPSMLVTLYFLAR
jgi:HlyD family secretion protein